MIIVVMEGDSMVVYVLVPSVTHKPIINEVLRTFDYDIELKLVHLTDRIINDYSDADKVTALRESIFKSIVDVAMDFEPEEDDVYLVLVGGIYHNIVAYNTLRMMGIPFHLLVYERRINRYVVFDDEGYFVTADRIKESLNAGNAFAL